METKKVFPINNEAACVFKWGWNTFRLYTGSSSSCHRIKNVFVPLDKFNDFHNTPEVLNDRALMLNGEWPTGRGCEYCKDVEDAGGISDRLYHNPMEGLTPVDFVPGENELHVTPRILEIYLNNTCDLSCVYCVPIFSSKINDELKKYGPFTEIGLKPIDRTPDHRKYFEKMIEWLPVNYHKLQRFLVQGGEPFLQKEFHEMLDVLETLENPQLEFSVNSNLNADISVFEKFIPRIKKMLVDRKIKRFDITCSIDCWGPQQEFARYGLNLNRWQKNFEFLLQHKWLYINTGHTMTSLTIKTMPDLQQILNNYLQQGYKFNSTYGYVDGPLQELYDPSIFGGKFFKNDLDKLVSITPEDTHQQKRAKERLIGIVHYIQNATLNPDRLKKLSVTLDQLDFRRKTNWRQIYPEIDQFFKTNGITNVVQ